MKSDKPTSPDQYDLQEIVDEIIRKMTAAEISIPSQKEKEVIPGRDFGKPLDSLRNDLRKKFRQFSHIQDFGLSGTIAFSSDGTAE